MTKASKDNALAEYRAKRKFDRTAEPKGSVSRGKGNRYVTQKHDATRLHYDFRLDLNGVLKSWAVTKGPSLDPADKRLAVRTEDHPLSYADFEGTIPKGEYGGGTVMLWDEGTWEPESDPEEGLRKGKLEFRLGGRRLKGLWALVRMRPKKDDKRENWLLIKQKDAAARTDIDITAARTRSVRTNRKMASISDAGKKNAGPQKEKAMSTGKDSTASVAGIPLTHPDRVLYPQQGVTKRDLAEYLDRVSERMLPHLSGRLLGLVRCPEGRTGQCFFQRHGGGGMPDEIRRLTVKGKQEDEEYLYIDDTKGLIAAAQMGVLEFHIWGSHIDKVERPDRIVFDLDPDPAIGFDAVKTGARRVVSQFGLTAP